MERYRRICKVASNTIARFDYWKRQIEQYKKFPQALELWYVDLVAPFGSKRIGRKMRRVLGASHPIDVDKA